MLFFKNFNPLLLSRQNNGENSSGENILSVPKNSVSSGIHGIKLNELPQTEAKAHITFTSTTTAAAVSKKYFASMSREIIWRLTSALMGIFFLLAAAVQHNDPDPYLWMPAYIIPCIISWTITLAYAQLRDMDSEKSTKKLNTRTIRRRGNKNPNQPLTPPSFISILLSKLDILIFLHIIYCFTLGIWTLSLCFVVERAEDVYEHEIRVMSTLQKNMDSSNFADGEESASISQAQLLRMAMIRMKDEEAKELLGLCLIIAWLSLLKNSNFIHLGKLGIGIGIILTILPFFSWILVEMLQENIMESANTC